MDSAGFIHMFMHTYSHKLIKEEIGREEFSNGWREDKKGGSDVIYFN